MAQQPLEGQGLLIIKPSRSQFVDAPHSVWLLWTSDQPETETSTWQHTTLTRDRSRCPLAGLELTVPAIASLQTHALDSTVTGIDCNCTMLWTNNAQWPVTYFHCPPQGVTNDLCIITGKKRFLFYTGLCFVKRTRPLVLREDRRNLQMEWKNRLVFSADFENRECRCIKTTCIFTIAWLTDRDKQKPWFRH
jgi:hypothetical protein